MVNYTIAPYKFVAPGPLFSASTSEKVNAEIQFHPGDVDLSDYPESHEMLGLQANFDEAVTGVTGIFTAINDDTGEELFAMSLDIDNFTLVRFWIGHASWEIARAMNVKLILSIFGDNVTNRTEEHFIKVIQTGLPSQIEGPNWTMAPIGTFRDPAKVGIWINVDPTPDQVEILGLFFLGSGAKSGDVVSQIPAPNTMILRKSGYQDFTIPITENLLGTEFNLTGEFIVEGEEPPPDEPPPERDPRTTWTIPVLMGKGYTEAQAVAIHKWMEDNPVHPTDEMIAKILGEEFIEIDDDDRMVLSRLKELSQEEQTEIMEADDIDADERNWLARFFNPDYGFMEGEVQSNVVPFAMAGVGTLAALNAGKILKVFRGFLGKGKSAMKYGFGVGAAWKKVGGTLTRTTTIGSVLSSPVAKGASALAGVNGMMVWLASDNILGGGTFLTNKLKKAVEEGVINTSSEITQALDSIESWMDTASSVVEISTNINPFLMPFKDVLLANRDQAQASFEMEKARIWEAYNKAQGGE